MRLAKKFTFIVSLLLICASAYAGPLPIAYLDHVVAIGRKDPTGKWIGEATGFLYGEFDHKVDDSHSAYHLFLVTNRHVIEEHIAATNMPLSVRLNSNSAVSEYDFPLQDAGKQLWHANPDPEVDLAVVLLNGPWLESLKVKFGYFRSDIDILSRAKAKDLGLSEGYGIFVLGFPMSLVGKNQDYVIVREGSIARVRDSLDAPSDEKTFLIDSLIFPGNSGSPVVLRPEPMEASFPGEKPAIRAAFLLGIVKGYIPYQDIAVSVQTHRPRVSFEENSGLSEVVPADYIDETIKEFLKNFQ